MYSVFTFGSAVMEFKALVLMDTISHNQWKILLPVQLITLHVFEDFAQVHSHGRLISLCGFWSHHYNSESAWS